MDYIKKSILSVAVLICLTCYAVSQPINSIRFIGLNLVQEDGVRKQISSKEGKPFKKDEIREDIKTLYRSGYFKSVSAEIIEDAGKRVLVFKLKEKPTVGKIKLVGNEHVKDETFNKELAIGSRRFFDLKKLDEAVERVEKYYQEKGFYDVDISYRVSEEVDGQVDVSFYVEEGDKLVIREIEFQGNKGIEADLLDDEILTGTYSWWISWATGRGILNNEKLEQDVARLSNYYLNNGYVEAQVAEPVVERIEDGLKVVYKIQEGEFYNFGEIRAEGDLLEEGEEATLAGIETQPSDMFSLETLRKDSFTISQKYTDRGYAFANVEPKTRVNRQSKSVDVIFAIDQGNLITVDRIVFSGNEKTSDNVIRRMLKIGENQLFSSSKINRSQELLQRLGFFDEVTITTDPSEISDSVNLNVGLKEAQTGSFSIGGGVSSGDGFIFSGRVSENNVFGTGNSLTLDINTGTRRENYVLSFLNPRVSDTRFSFGADLLSVKREFDDFDRRQGGGSVTLGYPLWFLGEEALDDIRASITYELLEVNIDNISDNAPQLVREEEGRSLSSSISPRIVRNTINNPLDPTKGSRQIARVEVAGLGGDEKFWMLRFNNDWYYSFHEMEAGPVTFAQRLDFGYGKTFNDDTFPLFRRFFAGGINSNRGFEARELGPKDEEGNEFGGNKELIANFELIFPLLSEAGIKGLVFYDVGNAFDDDQNIDFADFRHAAGFGIRWRSPLAPIRIEFGIPIDKEEGENSFVTHFSFGSPF